MGAILAAYFSGVMPISNLIYGFPATYRSYADKVMHHTFFGFDEIEAEALKEQGGVVHIGTDSVDGGYTLISKKKIEKASDIAGMKIRATGAVGLVFEELGASVVFMPGSELYTALATGVIDAVVYGGPQTELDQMKFGEVCDYLIMPELLTAHGHNTYIANPDAYEKLPNDLKAMLKTVNDVKTGDYYPYAKFMNQNAINKYVAEGQVEVITLPESEFNKIAAAGEAALARLVADANDPYLTRAAETLEEFMKWSGYWE
jgi:TRAP-type C4-dicarboxylate transport system substrate-binding protein